MFYLFVSLCYLRICVFLPSFGIYLKIRYRKDLLHSMNQNQGVRPQRKVNPHLAMGWVYHNKDLK